MTATNTNAAAAPAVHDVAGDFQRSDRDAALQPIIAAEDK